MPFAFWFTDYILQRRRNRNHLILASLLCVSLWLCASVVNKALSSPQKTQRHRDTQRKSVCLEARVLIQSRKFLLRKQEVGGLFTPIARIHFVA